MQDTMLMNGRQFAAWHKMYESDPEYADEVLRYFRNLVSPLSSEEEAIANLIAEDDEPRPHGIANHTVFGMANGAAKKLLEVA